MKIEDIKSPEGWEECVTCSLGKLAVFLTVDGRERLPSVIRKAKEKAAEITQLSNGAVAKPLSLT